MPNTPPVPNNPFLLSDKVYSFVKKLVQIVLPAISALYFGLAGIWNLPNAGKVVGTIACIQVFLGVVLGISSAQYTASGAAFDGDMVVTEKADGVKLFSLELTKDPEDFEHKKTIVFRIKKPDPLE